MKNIKIRIKLKKEKNEGSILIIGVAIMAFLLIFAVPFLFQSPADKKAADKSSCYSAALSLAEAGVERAIWEMNHGDISSWKGNSKLRTMTISSIQAPEVNVIGDIEIRPVTVFGEYFNRPFLQYHFSGKAGKSPPKIIFRGD